MTVKNHVKEKTLVEGVFVSLVGDGCGGYCLVRLTLSENLLTVATLDLSGTEIRDHITSVTPLSMLSFITDTKSRTITVRSVLQESQTYQFCSSSKEDVLWDLFMYHISNLPVQRDANLSPVLNAIYTDRPTRAVLETTLVPHEAHISRGFQPPVTWIALEPSTIVPGNEVFTGFTFDK